jgi:hypothetical protein
MQQAKRSREGVFLVQNVKISPVAGEGEMSVGSWNLIIGLHGEEFTPSFAKALGGEQVLPALIPAVQREREGP